MVQFCQRLQFSVTVQLLLSCRFPGRVSKGIDPSHAKQSHKGTSLPECRPQHKIRCLYVPPVHSRNHSNIQGSL